MSLGSRILIWGLVAVLTSRWAGGAAIQSTVSPPIGQQPLQRNGSEPQRNASAFGPDFREGPVLVSQPFGINNRQFQPPPPGFMPPQPPVQRPPGMPQPVQGAMNGPNQQPPMQPPMQPQMQAQQSQFQPPKREFILNATNIPTLKGNGTSQNNNTRRDTEQPITTTKPQVATATHKPSVEPLSGNEPKQPEGSKLKEHPPFESPLPTSSLFLRPVDVMNGQIVVNQMGQMFRLIPFVPNVLDPRLNPMFSPIGPPPQPLGPLGPPGPQGPMPMFQRMPFAQTPLFGPPTVIPDVNTNKQPFTPHMAEKSKNTTSTN